MVICLLLDLRQKKTYGVWYVFDVSAMWVGSIKKRERPRSNSAFALSFATAVSSCSGPRTKHMKGLGPGSVFEKLHMMTCSAPRSLPTGQYSSRKLAGFKMWSSMKTAKAMQCRCQANKAT